MSSRLYKNKINLFTGNGSLGPAVSAAATFAGVEVSDDVSRVHLTGDSSVTATVYIDGSPDNSTWALLATLTLQNAEVGVAEGKTQGLVMQAPSAYKRARVGVCSGGNLSACWLEY